MAPSRPDRNPPAARTTVGLVPGEPPGLFPELPADFGRYRVERRLGAGGMGSVYLAVDGPLQRRVALKFPHFAAGATGPALQRFYQEARAAAALPPHPNLCPVYDVGAIDGRHFLCLGFIEGTLLSAVLARQGPLRPAVAVGLARRLALALQIIHDHGILHRDLKPANVMISPRAEPVVMDFGLARRQGDAHKLTHLGVLLGTPQYMPPEQAAGDPSRVGPAGDVYALGVILFEMLTGRVPFTGASVEAVVRRVCLEPVPPPSSLRVGLDPTLDGLCLRALAKAPAGRYPSMADFAAALAAYRQQSDAGRGAAAAETTTFMRGPGTVADPAGCAVDFLPVPTPTPPDGHAGGGPQDVPTAVPFPHPLLVLALVGVVVLVVLFGAAAGVFLAPWLRPSPAASSAVDGDELGPAVQAAPEGRELVRPPVPAPAAPAVDGGPAAPLDPVPPPVEVPALAVPFSLAPGTVKPAAPPPERDTVKTAPLGPSLAKAGSPPPVPVRPGTPPESPPAPKPGPAAEDLQKLQGRWRVVRTEAQGQVVKVPPGLTVTFRGNTYRLDRGGIREQEGVIRLLAQKQRAETRVTWSKEEGQIGEVEFGIYRIEGDTATFCFAYQGGAYPTRLTTTPRFNGYLNVLRRE